MKGWEGAEFWGNGQRTTQVKMIAAVVVVVVVGGGGAEGWTRIELLAPA